MEVKLLTTDVGRFSPDGNVPVGRVDVPAGVAADEPYPGRDAAGMQKHEGTKHTKTV